MKLKVTVEKDTETGWFVAMCPLLPGCVSQGRTRKEALANIQEAAAGWLEVFQERLSNGEFGKVGWCGKIKSLISLKYSDLVV